MATPETQWKHSIQRFNQGIILDDSKPVRFGTDGDASVWYDGTRLTHANAEILFRKNISVPLYATTDAGILLNSKFTGIMTSDRAAYIKAVRVGWQQVPGTTAALGVQLRVAVVPVASPTTTEWVIGGAGGSVDVTTIGTAYFGHEYSLTTDTDILTLAAGDYVFASAEIPGALNTTGLGGVLTMEYEVYE